MAEYLLNSIWRASWQASILFAVVVLFVKLTPRVSSAVHCWAYRLVCLKLLLSFAVGPMMELAILPSKPSNSTSVVAPNFGGDSLAVIDQADDFTPSNEGVLSAFDEAANKEGRRLSKMFQAESSEVSKATTSWYSWQAGLLVLWAIGIAWQVCKLPRRLAELKQIQASAVDLQDTETGRLLRREAIEMKVPHCPSISRVVTTECPAVVGFTHPVILLPQSILNDVSETELRLLLRHELAHVYRRDLAWNWLAIVTQWLFFFHPVVGITLREWKLHQESACDELALGTTPENCAQYATLLLNVAVSKNPSPFSPSAVGIFESFETLKRRIEKMAYFGTESQRRQKLVMAAGALIAIVALLPWKPVPANSAMAAASAVALAPPMSAASEQDKSTTVVEGLKISFAGAADVSNRTHDYRTDLSQVKMTSDFNQDSTSVTKEFNKGSTQGSGSGSGFGAGGGGGGGSVIKFAGKPKLGVALQVDSKNKNQRISLVGELIGVDSTGIVHKSLPASGVTTMVVPDFEADHRDDVTAYFTGVADRIKGFESVKGQLLVETVDVDEVAFRHLRTGAIQKTKLGEYQITKVQQGPSGIQVAVRFPIPESLRSALVFQRMNPESARKRFAAQRQLQGLTQVYFVDSQGNRYRPNSAGTHGTSRSFSSRQETTTANGTSVKVSGGTSSHQPGVQEKLYGLTQIPDGAEIVGMVVEVSDVPTASQTVDFELNNVTLR